MRLGRIVSIGVFAAAAGYIGILCAVVAHEVLGHGLAAKIAGHELTGFTVLPDGMGWVEYEETSSPSVREEVAILLAGPSATYILTIVFLVSAWLVRRRAPLALLLAILGFAQLMDGAPYALWNALYPGPIIGDGGEPVWGDFGRIINVIPAGSPWLRWLIASFGAALTVVGAIVFNWFCFGLLARWFGNGAAARWGTATLALFIQTLAWLAFDWNQLAPGSGAKPQILGIGIAGATLAVLAVRAAPTKEPAPPIPLAAVAIVAIIAVAGLAWTILWGQYGVSLT